MNSLNKPKSPQTRILRGILFRKTLAYLTIYTLCFGVIALWANTYWVPDFANLIADKTSKWLYFTPEQYDAFVTESSSEQLSNMDVYSGTTENGSTQYAVRDLTTYHFIRSLKLPAALCLYFIGTLVIAFIVLNKSLQYFDTLSSSVGKLLSSKDAHVDLPDELSIVRNELSDIKAQSIEAERHAINAEKRKNELVAYLAHDIKTPLTSILGYLTLLKEPQILPDKQRQHYADIALDKAEHLEGLIDEFFEITRYNLQSIPIERETFDLQLFCQQIADDFYPEAERKQLSIKVEPTDTSTSGNINLLVFADPDKLARAVSNVMRNALAYAESQSTITMKLIPTPKGNVIVIENKGKEISPTHLQSIFEKFFRGDTSRNSKQGGAGLGLAIAKEIMLAHGGDITATSEHGVTIFRLFIPAC